MSHRCRDDTLGWLLLILALDAASSRCCCAHDDGDDAHDFSTDEFRSRSPNKPNAPAWRHPLAVAAFVLTAGVIGAVVGRVVVADSAAAHERIPVVALPDRADVFDDAAVAGSSSVQSTAITAGTLTLLEIAEPLPGAISIVPFAPEPLPSQDTVPGANLSPAITRTFDIGSSREEVIAAQGSAPTYAKGNTLWWGSSKVMFTRDGFVESWTQGTPSLRVRERRLIS